MAFSQSSIADVRVIPDGADLFVAWSYTGAGSPTFQVYADRRLAWSGTGGRCHIPGPPAPGQTLWVEVGTVDASEATRDYSAALTSPGNRVGRAHLAWTGGTYLDATGGDNIEGYRIFQGPAPGAPVDDSAPVAVLPAYPGGRINDGFGKGGFGAAGFGRTATTYRWQSPPLAAGAWAFRVVPFDRSGTSRPSGRSVVVNVASAPAAPARAADGSRLTLNYDGPATGQATLRWLPSPTDPR